MSKLSQGCLDSLDLTINNFVDAFSGGKDKLTSAAANAATSKLFSSLKLIGSVVLLACLFPALPFLIVMAATLAIIKYFLLRIRNL